jgi:nitroreductase
MERVLSAAALAPTAKNLQPFRLHVMPVEGHEDDFKRVYRGDFLREAPLVILASVYPETGWKRRDGKLYADVDGAIMFDHLVLAAWDEGLRCCWIAAFDPQAVREIFHLEAGEEPLVMSPFGYAGEGDVPRPKIRKGWKEFTVFHDGYPA